MMSREGKSPHYHLPKQQLN